MHEQIETLIRQAEEKPLPRSASLLEISLQ